MRRAPRSRKLRRIMRPLEHRASAHSATTCAARDHALARSRRRPKIVARHLPLRCASRPSVGHAPPAEGPRLGRSPTPLAARPRCRRLRSRARARRGRAVRAARGRGGGAGDGARAAASRAARGGACSSRAHATERHHASRTRRRRGALHARHLARWPDGAPSLVARRSCARAVPRMRSPCRVSARVPAVARARASSLAARARARARSYGALGKAAAPWHAGSALSRLRRRDPTPRREPRLLDTSAHASRTWRHPRAASRGRRSARASA